MSCRPAAVLKVGSKTLATTQSLLMQAAESASVAASGSAFGSSSGALTSQDTSVAWLLGHPAATSEGSRVKLNPSTSVAALACSGSARA